MVVGLPVREQRTVWVCGGRMGYADRLVQTWRARRPGFVINPREDHFGRFYTDALRGQSRKSIRAKCAAILESRK